MDFESSDLWLTIAILSISLALTGIARRILTFNPIITLLGQLPKLLMRGIQVTIHDLYTKFVSVFTMDLFGHKITFLIGPEVSAHFFQAPESEINQEVDFGVDSATRSEQSRFSIVALRSSKLRNHVDPMLQEVEVFYICLHIFAKWGQEGIIDLKHELSQVLLLISGRCLLGKEIRENMLGEFYALFHDIENDLNLNNLVFPYIPTAINRHCDRAPSKLTEMLSKIDALKNLIHSKYRDGHSMTESEVTGLMVALVFVGKHTSSQSSAWTGAYLLNDQIIKKHRDQIDYGVLLEMDTLHGCIKEALWLHPTTPVLIRKAHKHFTRSVGERSISKKFLRSCKLYLGYA
ncbi:hypothetical protein VPH35_003187 [Triticum aestivum]